MATPVIPATINSETVQLVVANIARIRPNGSGSYIKMVGESTELEATQTPAALATLANA